MPPSFETAYIYIRRLLHEICTAGLDGLLFRDRVFYSGDQLMFADMIRFILTYPNAPSIKKAHYFLYNVGGFKHARNLSGLGSDYYTPTEALFNKKWNAIKTVCSFHFADVYFFNRKMAALPDLTSLDTDVDNLLADKAGLEAFFRTALNAARFLEKNLDPRTFKGKHRLAKFPKELTPLKPTLAGLNELQLTKMSRYKSA